MPEDVGRKILAPISELFHGSNLLFVDEHNDQLDLSGIQVTLCIFRRLGGRYWKVRDSGLKYSVFENCYFHNAKFKDVDFTGSVFIDCDLDEAMLTNCTLSYTRFQRTLVDHRQVQPNLPSFPNVRRELAHDLQINALALGRKQQADVFLRQEIDADREHHIHILKAEAKWYRERYGSGWTTRGGALLYLVGLAFSEHFWGYGLSILSLLRALLVIIGLVTLLIMVPGLNWLVSGETEPRQLSFGEAVYAAVSSLVGGGFGDVQPADSIARVLGAGGSLVGIIFLGLFVTALYRKISR